MAGLMQAAGPWREATSVVCTRYLVRCQLASRASSISVADLMADPRGPGLEESFPFGEDDSEGEDEEALNGDPRESKAKMESLERMELQGRSSCEVQSQDMQVQKQVQVWESSLTPWEMWFVGKEKEERYRLQQKILEELNKQIEKRKEMEEREKRKIIAEEKHKQWVQKKNEQERKEREQKINKEMEEKAAKKLAKRTFARKSKRKIQRVVEEKKAEECEKKKKKRIPQGILWSCHFKEKEQQRQAELQEKKEIAEKKFKEWLENAKNKPRPAAKSYGYASGKLTDFYNGNSYPEPAFYNPIPWKPIHMPRPKEAKSGSGKKSKSVPTQPLRRRP